MKIKEYSKKELGELIMLHNSHVLHAYKMDADDHEGMLDLIINEADDDASLVMPCIEIASNETLSGAAVIVDLDWQTRENMTDAQVLDALETLTFYNAEGTACVERVEQEYGIAIEMHDNFDACIDALMDSDGVLMNDEALEYWRVHQAYGERVK